MADALAGGCACGAIRYEVTPGPVEAAYCHCSMCRKATGGPFGLFMAVPADRVTWHGDAPRRYRSSRIAERWFCAVCGAPLLFRYVEDRWIDLAVGSLDRPDLVPPSRHGCIETKLSWLEIRDGLPTKGNRVDPARL